MKKRRKNRTGSRRRRALVRKNNGSTTLIMAWGAAFGLLACGATFKVISEAQSEPAPMEARAEQSGEIVPQPPLVSSHQTRVARDVEEGNQAEAFETFEPGSEPLATPSEASDEEIALRIETAPRAEAHAARADTISKAQARAAAPQAQARAAAPREQAEEDPQAKRIEVLRSERRAVRAGLRRAEILRRLGKVAELREELEERRRIALGAIFDTARYRKDAAGNVLGRAPVEAAVARVREIAELRIDCLEVRDRRRVVLQARLDAELSRLGEAPIRDRFDMWLLGLAAGPQVLLELPLDRADCERLAMDRAIRAANARLPQTREARVTQVTNAYRRIMGRKALLADARLNDAARDHSRAMVRMNFFSHESPLSGRRTPNERVKEAGFPLASAELPSGPLDGAYCLAPAGQPRVLDFTCDGVRENIAQNHGCPQVVFAWCDSPGHHRNVLNPDCDQTGAGACGNTWTQLFCRGELPEGVVPLPEQNPFACACKCKEPEPEPEPCDPQPEPAKPEPCEPEPCKREKKGKREKKSKCVETKPEKGNNGVGNGEDPQPPGNPPVNDGPGTSPGNPGNKGGATGKKG